MVLDVRKPVHKGLFSAISDAEAIWNHAFSLLSAVPEEHPVLLAETSATSAAIREKVAETMFEGADAIGLCCVKSSVLALLSVGKTTGTVLNAGHENTQASAVYEGSEIPVTVREGELSGCDLSSYLESLSPALNPVTTETSPAERMQLLKSSLFVSCDPSYEMKHSTSGPAKSFILPDGAELPYNERFMCPEVLFTPTRIGHTCPSVQRLIHGAVLRSPKEIQPDLLANIVLCGGTTLIKGFDKRVETEIKGCSFGGKVRVCQAEDGGNAAWHGGSILSSLSSFEQALITKDEFDELGPRVVNWKCF